MESTSFFKEHPFDKELPESYRARQRKSWVTTGLAPLTGVAPLRERFFKVDESRIDDLTRMGLSLAEAESILQIIDRNEQVSFVF